MPFPSLTRKPNLVELFTIKSILEVAINEINMPKRKSTVLPLVDCIPGGQVTSTEDVDGIACTTDVVSEPTWTRYLCVKMEMFPQVGVLGGSSLGYRRKYGVD